MENISIAQMSSWNTLQVLNDNDSSDILFPVVAVGSCSQSGKCVKTAVIYADSLLAWSSLWCFINV